MFFDLFISHCKAKKVLIRYITKIIRRQYASITLFRSRLVISTLESTSCALDRRASARRGVLKVEFLERFLRCRRNSFLEMSMRFTRRHFVFNE